MKKPKSIVFQRLVQREELGITLVLILVCLCFSLTTKSFATIENVALVVRQFSIVGIMAVGMFFVISGGGIDLSIGAILAVSATVVAQTLKMGIPTILSIVLGLIVGGLLGMFNGLVVTKLRIREIIATLGMAYVLRGSLLFIAGAKWITNLPESFTFIGQGFLAGIPVPIYILTIVVLGAHLFSGFTPIGRQVKAVGGNVKAAALSGVNVERIKVMTFLLGGLAAGIGGILFAARMGSIQTNAGTGMEFQVIGSALIGGATFSGEGSPLGAVLGAALLGVLSNGLVLLGVSVFLEGVVVGSLIIIATVVNILRSRYEIETSLAG